MVAIQETNRIAKVKKWTILLNILLVYLSIEKIKVMKKLLIEIQMQEALKNLDKGINTENDTLAIVRYQMPECELDDLMVARLAVSYQAAFN